MGGSSHTGIVQNLRPLASVETDLRQVARAWTGALSAINDPQAVAATGPAAMAAAIVCAVLPDCGLCPLITHRYRRCAGERAVPGASPSNGQSSVRSFRRPSAGSERGVTSNPKTRNSGRALGEASITR